MSTTVNVPGMKINLMHTHNEMCLIMIEKTFYGLGLIYLCIKC